MTLVFQRDPLEGPRVPAGPRTHAFVLGCGRFPTLGAAAERASTVAGARAIIRYLIEQRDSLVAPLGSIECLLSDPSVAPGQDVLGLGAFDRDPRVNDHVAAVVTPNVQSAGEAWLSRCEAGDHMFFYMSSHGIADQNVSAAGLFEDVLANRYKKWSASLNVNVLCTNLPVTQAAACWVFLDACQELIPALLGNNSGLAGVTLVDASPTELANVQVRSVGIAGSRYGEKAWAPNGPNPPYFTQALLRSFNSCVNFRADGQWVVTGDRLLFNIEKVADAAYGYAALKVDSLSPFATPPELVTVQTPLLPVVVRTKDLAHMAFLQKVTITNGQGPGIEGTPQLTDCFFEVPPSGQQYVATGVFTQQFNYQPAQFYAAPCAQIVQLCP